VGLSVVQVPLYWFGVVTVGAVAVLIPATAPKLRWWHSSASAQGVTPGDATGRSVESLEVTRHLAAPVGKPVRNLRPPRD
jgi:hypothetical protein